MSRNLGGRVRVHAWVGWLVAATLGGILSQAASRASAEGQDEADHVYFVLTIDPNCSGVGRDRDNVVQTIETALKEQRLDGRYEFKVLSVTTDWVPLSGCLGALNPERNDTIVFYYTGSGGFDVDNGHFLELEKGTTRLYRKDLLPALARYPHRATIVLTDCCAVLPRGTPARLTDPQAGRPGWLPGFTVGGMPKGNGEVVRDLFFRSRGIVNITASRTGSMACMAPVPASEGSHFTAALCKLLDVGRGAFHAGADLSVTWDEFFPQLEKLTFAQAYKWRQPNQRVFQTPEKFMLGPARSAEGQDPPRNPILSRADELTQQDRPADKAMNGQDPNGTLFYHKFCTAPMSKAKAYLVSLHSLAFDTYLYVADPQFKSVLATKVGRGRSTTPSRIVFFPPSDGQYFIGVTSYGPRETGRFSLTVEESTFADELTATDPLDRFCAGAFSKVHPVRLTALRPYTIRLVSEGANSLQPYLRVEDQFGDTLALNDDQHRDALSSVVTFRPQTTGTYYLIATSFEERRTGKYAVFVQE